MITYRRRVGVHDEGFPHDPAGGMPVAMTEETI
jgi:hypothetical protein